MQLYSDIHLLDHRFTNKTASCPPHEQHTTISCIPPSAAFVRRALRGAPQQFPPTAPLSRHTLEPHTPACTYLRMPSTPAYPSASTQLLPLGFSLPGHLLHLQCCESLSSIPISCSTGSTLLAAVQTSAAQMSSRFEQKPHWTHADVGGGDDPCACCSQLRVDDAHNKPLGEVIKYRISDR